MAGSLDKIVGFYSIPGDASPAEVRRRALPGFGLGLLVFGVGLVIFLAAKSFLHDEGVELMQTGRPVKALVGGPLAIGYLLTMKSLYHLATGTPPGKESTSAIASLGRILFGLVATIALIVLVVVVATAL
jgi:hypothetical protein